MKCSKNRRKTSEKIILDDTPPGLLVKKCGYTLVDLGDEVYRLRIENGEKIKEKTPYHSIRRAFLGEINLEEENKKYILQILKCSPEELEIALNKSRRFYLRYKKCLNNLSAREEKELVFLNSGLSNSNSEYTGENVYSISSQNSFYQGNGKVEGDYLANFNLSNHDSGNGQNKDISQTGIMSFLLDTLYSTEAQIKLMLEQQNFNLFSHKLTNLYYDYKEKQLLAYGCRFIALDVLSVEINNDKNNTQFRKKCKLRIFKDGVRKIKWVDTYCFISNHREAKSNSSDKLSFRENSSILCSEIIVNVTLKEPSQAGQVIEFYVVYDNPPPTSDFFYTFQSRRLLKIEDSFSMMNNKSVQVPELIKMDESDYSVQALDCTLVYSDSEEGRKLKQVFKNNPGGNHRWHRIDCKNRI